MEPYKPLIILALSIFSCFGTSAQENNAVAEKTTPKEFSIPASPVFDLMGVSPVQVTNLSDYSKYWTRLEHQPERHHQLWYPLPDG
jgi:hypothetical protein